MILAGDIGGTNVRLALFEVVDGRRVERRRERYPTAGHPSLEAVVEKFLGDSPTAADVSRAGFGIAGPVRDGRCEATNIPWIVDARLVAARLGLPRVALVNDLAANAYGLADLAPTDVVVLNRGEEDPVGAGALISAGTGLGEAILLRDEELGWRPLSSEGGHCSFAPRGRHEIDLLGWLSDRFGHVSFERILSGPGLSSLYRFERERSGEPEPPWLTAAIQEAGDAAPAVSAAALAGKDGVAEKTLHRFAAIYGSEAGNLALKALATAGVTIGGGIAPRILPKLLDGTFFTAFCDKGRFAPLLSRIPIRVITNDACALLGAARAATSL